MELATYLPYLVNRLGQRFVAEIAPALAGSGIDVQTWRVLIALYQQGDRPVGALADLTSINISTLSRLIGRMEAKALVERRRGSDDARSVIVGLTPEGRAATERILPRAAALESEATADFTEAELATLRQLLVKLYAGLDGEGAARQEDRLAG
ncbi:MAG: MarR family winged helix-turn-helix transcriptional regulator [Rhodospirillaceae bacterium]